MKLSEIPNSDNLDECRSQITEIQRLLEQTMQDTRNLTFKLSPPILYELGLEPAVEWLTERFYEQHNISTVFANKTFNKFGELGGNNFPP